MIKKMGGIIHAIISATSGKPLSINETKTTNEYILNTEAINIPIKVIDGNMLKNENILIYFSKGTLFMPREIIFANK